MQLDLLLQQTCHLWGLSSSQTKSLCGTHRVTLSLTKQGQTGLISWTRVLLSSYKTACSCVKWNILQVENHFYGLVCSCVQFSEVEEGMVRLSGEESVTETIGSHTLPGAGCSDIWPGWQTPKLCGWHLHPSVPLPICCGSLLRTGWCLVCGVFQWTIYCLVLLMFNQILLEVFLRAAWVIAIYLNGLSTVTYHVFTCLNWFFIICVYGT